MGSAEPRCLGAWIPALSVTRSNPCASLLLIFRQNIKGQAQIPVGSLPTVHGTAAVPHFARGFAMFYVHPRRRRSLSGRVRTTSAWCDVTSMPFQTKHQNFFFLKKETLKTDHTVTFLEFSLWTGWIRPRAKLKGNDRIFLDIWRPLLDFVA